MSDIHKEVDALRIKITEKKQLADELAVGSIPVATALKHVDTFIAEAASQASSDGFQFTEHQCRPASPIRDRPDGVFNYLCRIMPEAVRADLINAVKAAYAEGLTEADEPKREKLLKEVRELEVKEEKIISDAAKQGIRIVRRADADPAVVLGT